MKKRILITGLLLAALSACDKHAETGQPEESQLPDMLVLSGVKPDETSVKTYYDDASKSILWSPTGEKIRIVVSDVSEFTQDGYPTMYLMGLESSEGAISEGGKTASFSVPLEEDPDSKGNERTRFPTKEGKYRFHAVYPSVAANSGLGNYTPWDWLISIGSDMDNFSQHPTADGFDPSCDVMLGISKYEYSNISKGMNIPMIYERLVTHGKITLTNLPSELKSVSEVQIVAPESKTLVGIYYINVINKSQSYDKGNFNTITLKYDHLEKDKENGGREVVDQSMDLWFCTQPFELSEGEPLQIILHGKDASGKPGIVSRTINARTEGIKFEKNKLSTLGVNMGSCPFTAFYCQLSASKDDWKETTEFHVPRKASVTSFYLKTNIQSYYNFASQFNADEVEFEFTDGFRTVSQEIASDGSTIYQIYIAAKENHKVSRTTTLPYRLSFPEEEISLDFTVTQCGGNGDLVLGDWTGDYIPMGDILWYPVNVGATAEHPYGGKYFQWGRKDGQLPWLEDNSYSIKQSNFDDDGKFVGTPDPKVTYITGTSCPCWFDKKLDNLYEANHPFDWPSEDTDPGMGNPCPDGWRMPTVAEWKTFKDSFSQGTTMTHTDGYMYNEFYKSYSDIPYILILPQTGEINYQYLEHPETFNPRFDPEFGDRVYGYYWCSDIYAPGGGDTKTPWTLRTNGSGYNEAKMQLFGQYTGFAVAVRCVKDNK